MTKQKYLCNICNTNIGMHKCINCGDSICEKCIIYDDIEEQHFCIKCNELNFHKIKIK